MWLRQTYPAHLVRRLLILAVTGGLLLALFVGWASRAEASPVCSANFYGRTGVGFCDWPLRADGTKYHCERIVIGGWGGQNCFDVRPVPVEIDPRGWVPVR